jgi:hypothetical protein
MKRQVEKIVTAVLAEVPLVVLVDILMEVIRVLLEREEHKVRAVPVAMVPATMVVMEVPTKVVMEIVEIGKAAVVAVATMAVAVVLATMAAAAVVAPLMLVV